MAKEAIKKQFNKKTKSIRFEDKRQCIVGSQKYPIESTLKETGPEEIWTFQDFKEHWLRNISARITKRMGNSQCVQ